MVRPPKCACARVTLLRLVLYRTCMHPRSLLLSCRAATGRAGLLGQPAASCPCVRMPASLLPGEHLARAPGGSSRLLRPGMDGWEAMADASDTSEEGIAGQVPASRARVQTTAGHARAVCRHPRRLHASLIATTCQPAANLRHDPVWTRRIPARTWFDAKRAGAECQPRVTNNLPVASPSVSQISA